MDMRPFFAHRIVQSCFLGVVCLYPSYVLALSFTFESVDVPIPNVPPNIVSTEVNGIDDVGNAVGTYLLGDGTTHGFMRTKDGTFSHIDYPSAALTRINGVSPNGKSIVGDFTIYIGAEQLPFQQPYISTNGHFTPISSPGHIATATGVNSEGTVCGNYFVSGTNFAFIYSKGAFTALKFPGATQTFANGISNDHKVVGSYELNGVVHGFVFHNGSYTTVDDPTAMSTYLSGINAAGDMVGSATHPGNINGFLLSNGEFTTIEFPSTGGSGANGINAHRQIVGNYTTEPINAIVVHGFIATPMPGNEKDALKSPFSKE
jgi:uncharacterized membrane protein